MSHSEACCSHPAVVSNYKPVGTVITLKELPVYVVGPEQSKKAVFVFPDVFGFHDNTKQFCDILARKTGYKVVFPEFFFQEPLDGSWLENANDRPKIQAWIQRRGDFDVVLPFVNLVEDYLKKHGVEAATLVGFCWGAKISVLLTKDHPLFVGAALIHPSRITTEDGKEANAPILNILTKDEPDLTAFMDELKKKPFGDLCKEIRYEDMHHGYCAARGNFDDENNVKRVGETITETIAFYEECFKAACQKNRVKHQL